MKTKARRATLRERISAALDYALLALALMSAGYHMPHPAHAERPSVTRAAQGGEG